MRTNTKSARIISLLVMALLVLLVQACGQPVAKDQGCPSDTFLANATDTITAPPNIDWVGDSYFGFPNPGGTVLMTPLDFIVKDSAGDPRPNVCLFAYTADTDGGLAGPFWYNDDKYTTVIFGSGAFNARTIITDDTGVARVFWSSADLPPALPALITGGTTTAPTYTPGKDQAGTSYINIHSGTKAATFNLNWTIKGEPGPT